MRVRLSKTIYFALIAIVFSMAANVAAQTRAYRVSDSQVQTLLNRIETRTDAFRRQMDGTLDRSVLDNTRREENITQFITDFENATDSLRRNFNERDSVAADVEDVLNRAALINNFMRNNRLTTATQNQWNQIQSDLNTLANYYRVSWTWNSAPTTGGGLSYSATDSQVQTLLVRIEQRTDTLRNVVDRWSQNRRNNTNSNENFAQYFTDFENATDSLKRNFDERDSVGRDVEDVLQRGAVIDRYFRSNTVNTNAQRQWSLLRSDLSTLANYYRVAWNWNNPTYPTSPNYPNNPTYPNNSSDALLTGTYRLNVGQSDNVSSVIQRALSSSALNANQRERIERQLERRLTAPETMVIEKNGQQITLASSLSQQVSFSADGVSRSETTNNGRTMSVRASSTGSDLTINYEGDRMNDFYVSFMPDNNRRLRVMRRVFLENRNESVTVTSVYDKIDNIARFDNITNQNNYPNTTGTTSGDFVIPNNTRLTATLDTPLSTKAARDGDRFTMTVSSPSQYQGAVIEGRVIGERSGIVSGRATLNLNFETIRLRNGNSYRFTGIVDQVRDPDGDTVSVNNEGAVRDGNQTTKTVTRAGIGAALGAIIGAIAGGGQGAAVGAAIGAGAGAGSVILQGRDNLELQTGTEFMITATAPGNVRSYR